MTFITFTLEQLCISPLNVRKNEEDANAVDALAASIEANGLLQPLLVHPVPEDATWGEDADFAVLAGGRRLRAIRRLAEKGAIPPDWPIEARIKDLDDGEIILLSAEENLRRRDLRPYEVHRLVADAHAAGKTSADIALQLDQSERWVSQQLRLGRLAPEIFDAYAAGELSAELAQAYAATEDVELQRAAWAHFTRNGSLDTWSHNERAVRAFLKVDDREEARLLRFIGEDVYRAAGGRFELDLFSDGPDRGRVVDPGRLRELAENKLGDLRQRLRRRTGRSDLQFLAEPPQRHGRTDWTLHLEVHEFDPRADSGIALPDVTVGQDIAAHIAIEDDGDWSIAFWWPTAKARRAANRAEDKRAATGCAPPERSAEGENNSSPRTSFNHRITANEALGHPDSAYDQAARAAVREEYGFTSDALQIARALRRVSLRALLVEDASGGGTLGREYVLWSSLRQELTDDRWSDIGARALVGEWHLYGGDREPTDKVEPVLAETEANAVWQTALKRIAKEPFIALEDPDEAFVAWLDALEPVRNLASAVLAGLSLVRSANAPGWRLPTHDRLAALSGAQAEHLHTLAAPSEKLVGLLPKLKRLELAQPIAGTDRTAEWSKRGDREITEAVTACLRDAADWVHPVIGFPTLTESQKEPAE